MTITKETVTQITLVQPKPVRAPSLWGNLIVLVALFGLMVGAKTISDRWLHKELPVENPETQIILEDHTNEQPLAESPEVQMEAPAEKATAEKAPVEKVTAAPIKKKETQETENRQQATDNRKQTAENGKQATAGKTKKKADAAPRKNAYAEPDPYTSGGPLDLDRPANRNASEPLRTGSPQTAVANPSRVERPKKAPASLGERDQFIPFESE